MNKSKNASDPDLKEAFGELTDNLQRIARNHVEGAEEELRNHYESATRFIRENPLTAILGALTLGYIVARVVKKERIVYVEKNTP